jgi:multidrug resistance efflux pump
VRVRKVFDSALVSEKDLDAAEEILALRQKNVEVAKGELDLLLAGARPEEIQKITVDMEILKKKREFYLSQLEDTEIRSPIAGVVATPYLEYRLDENIEPGTELCEVVDTREIIAEIMVPEKEAGDIQPGNVVKLKAQGYPGESFWGRVTEIATAAQTDGDRRIVRVRTRLYNENGMLKPGMSGRAKVYCGKKTLWTLASRRVIRYLRTEFLF